MPFFEMPLSNEPLACWSMAGHMLAHLAKKRASELAWGGMSQCWTCPHDEHGISGIVFMRFIEEVAGVMSLSGVAAAAGTTARTAAPRPRS